MLKLQWGVLKLSYFNFFLFGFVAGSLLQHMPITVGAHQPNTHCQLSLKALEKTGQEKTHDFQQCIDLY